ncbi:MAG TPA: hypothetical protein VFS03_07130, partial [Microvirga sp.]|nr:hypothetical protein [Microvirga sp.]
DPVVSIARTAFALDAYQADRAILNAREALRRYRARGGYFAPLAVNRQGGSYTAGAYRFIGLDAWARYYGDRVFNPFDAASYFDQAIAARPRVFTERPTLSSVEGDLADLAAFNLVVQGLLFDPLAVSGRIARTDLLRRPFLDVELGGGVIERDGRIGWQAEANVQGFSNSPVPTAFSLNAERLDGNGRRSNDRESAESASVFVGVAPSAADRFLVFGSAASAKPGLASLDTPPQSLFQARDATTAQAAAGWSHTFGYRNVLTGAVYASRNLEKRYDERSLDALPVFFLATRTQTRTRVDGAVAALNHAVGFGDLTLRYGAELQSGDTVASSFGRVVVASPLNDPPVQSEDVAERASGSFSGGRLYGDLLWRPAEWFEAEAGVQRTLLDLKGQSAEEFVAPRVGVAVAPFEGQWLRAAYRKDAELPLPFTLAPVTTLGLVPNALPTSLGGSTETLALRWDAEWTPRLFTSLDYQRQKVRALEVPIADVIEGLAVEKAEIERAAATANLWLGHGIGVFGTVGIAHSETKAGEGVGFDVPTVSGRFARAGLAFVHESRLRLTVSQTFVGDRTGDLAGTRLKDFWTTDAAVTWETPDRRLLFGLTLLNLLDADYDLAPGVEGPGRTVGASLKARF